MPGPFLALADWERLKSELTARRVRVVALDLPTSCAMATNSPTKADGVARNGHRESLMSLC